jgi:tRNA dimethylallyltransferase
LTPGVRVVVVLGATATGKTALSIRLAEQFGGEVVNADSRYLYRGMDVGTAKPSDAERRGIAHHLVDILDPWDDFSLAAYLDLAYAAIEDVAARGRLPLVVGGTPQYLRALIEGWVVPRVAPDAALRAELQGQPTEALYERLRAADPDSAARIGPANKRRMIRALEILALSGRPMSAQQGREPPPYAFLLLGLEQEREQLYARIDRRVCEMFAIGWLDEVQRLRARGATRELPAMSAHGYREALDVLDGRLALDDAIRQTSQMVHRYVRHQQTWFRRFGDIVWFDSSEPGYEERVARMVAEFLES